MRDVQDLESGIHYLEMASKPREAPAGHESTIGEGLTIVIGFMLMVILMFAVA